MCGIFAFLYNSYISTTLYDVLYDSFMKLEARGPDDHSFKIYDNMAFGFHRLRINDLTAAGDQPMIIDENLLICNGEIYNHKQLENTYDLKVKSGSDCESILHLYNKIGDIKTVVNLLDGEFAGIIYDKKQQLVHVFRDPYGVRPLFFGLDAIGNLGFASELKGLNELCVDVQQILPGCTMTIKEKEIIDYSPYFSKPSTMMSIQDKNWYADNIRTLFIEAVNKRLMSDRDVCCLLSGGLDSSLVCSVASKLIAPKKLHTFSIGMKGSTDLEYAKIVAEHIDSIHHSVELCKEDFLEAIEETIKIIESYDITSVRASVGNYLITKYIKSNTDYIVVLNGDFSDEIFASYLYFKECKDPIAFKTEAERLLSEITYFDSLRSDRSVSANGLEARCPFSDRDLVNFVMSIPIEFRMNHDKIEKDILRLAFTDVDDCFLPKSILLRVKEAFSDGISSGDEDSWHKVIKRHIDKLVTDDEFLLMKDEYKYNTPYTKESYYYRKIFDKYYPDMETVIPHFWLPKQWDETKPQEMDPSARALKVYNAQS